MTDELFLVVGTKSTASSNGITVKGGKIISGWTGIRLTRGMERCPSDFEISMTEAFPGEHDFIVQPGDTCSVALGDDTVLTGYVDRYISSISSRGHSITISGRSRCQDLVDCSADWPGFQIKGSSALEIAQKLASTYGISVVGEVDTGDPIPQFNLNFGETAFSTIERICRYRALLAYDDVNGNLVLSRVSRKVVNGIILEGSNIQSARVLYANDQRFSDYVVVIQSAVTLTDAGNAGYQYGIATDVGIKQKNRYRLKYVVAEAAVGGIDVAQRRAIWEMNRRVARGSAVFVTIDSWRDLDGKLWEPNTLVNVSIPTCKISGTLCIGEVTYNRSESGGTSCNLVLMPPDAFIPEPIVQPAYPDIPPGVGK